MILCQALCVSQKHLTPCPSRESEKLETSLRSYFKSSVWAIVTSSLALQACPLLSCSTSNEFSSHCWSSENPRSSPKCCTPYPAFGSHRETRAAAVWHPWADVGWAVLNQAATPPRLCDTLQPSDCCVTQINTSNNVFDGKFLFRKVELQTDKWAKAVWWL